MNLNEYNLDGYKHILKNDWDFPIELEKYLMNNGFTFVGAGGYSSVYKSSFVSKNKPFVIKVNNGPFDSNYLKFVDFCHKNRNQHLPKLGNIKKLIDKKTKEEWFIIFIEKLDNKPLNDFPSLQNYFFKITLKDDYYSNDDNLIEYMDEEFSEEENYLKYKNQIFEMSKIMIKFTKDTGLIVNDLHKGNIIFRGNTLVIIDPVQ